MDKSQIKRKVSKLKDFSKPKASYEQYSTPPQICATVAHHLSLSLDNPKVTDLGAGVGHLSVAAALTGSEVDAVEVEEQAVKTLEQNISKIGLSESINVVREDVSDCCVNRVVVMNPPFSVHSDGLEKFLRKAMDSERLYTVLPRGFDLESFVKGTEHAVMSQRNASISIPPNMGFHTKNAHEAEITLATTEKQQ
jgi:predicted RNA methylase